MLIGKAYRGKHTATKSKQLFLIICNLYCAHYLQFIYISIKTLGWKATETLKIIVVKMIKESSLSDGFKELQNNRCECVNPGSTESHSQESMTDLMQSPK